MEMYVGVRIAHLLGRGGHRVKSALSLQGKTEWMRWGPGRFFSCRLHTDIQIRSALVCTKEYGCETAHMASGWAYENPLESHVWDEASSQARHHSLHILTPIGSAWPQWVWVDGMLSNRTVYPLGISAQSTALHPHPRSCNSSQIQLSRLRLTLG